MLRLRNWYEGRKKAWKSFQIAQRRLFTFAVSKAPLGSAVGADRGASLALEAKKRNPMGGRKFVAQPILSLSPSLSLPLPLSLHSKLLAALSGALTLRNISERESAVQKSKQRYKPFKFPLPLSKRDSCTQDSVLSLGSKARW